MSEHKYVNMQVVTDFKLHGDIIDGITQTQLFAETPRIAKELMEQRHLDEHINMFETAFRLHPINDLPSELYEAGKLREALHAACWLGFIACKAGVVKGEDLLDDNGVIHNLSHLCLPDEILKIQSPEYMRLMKEHVPKALKKLEHDTPGFHKWLTKKQMEVAKEANKEAKLDELL